MIRPSMLLAALAVAGLAAAQDPTTLTTKEPTGFLPKTLTLGGTEHRYVVYVPPGYRRGQPSPLLVFLNGMGECGTDGQRQVEVGLGPAIRKEPERWPFVVVFPQKPDKPSQWIDHEALVMGVLAATEQQYSIDGRRRFLTGLSQGGAGTWALGSKHADVWAAIAPVCGYGKPAEVAPGLKAMPIWAFHGLDDRTVPAQQSKDLCAAVERAGGDPVLTLYENTAHNSWDKAYRDSGLAEWLRMVAAEPVGARYLAGPEALPRVRITMARRRAGADEGDVRDKVVTEMVAGALRLQYSGDDKDVDREVAATSVGEAAAERAAVLLFLPLRALWRDGAFAAPRTEGAALAPGGYHFDVLMRGPRGVWEFRGALDGAGGPERGAQAALRRAFEAAAARR